jgi:hypothetical protein
MNEAYAMAFIASFVGVGLKAAQQLNVVHHKVWWIPPISYGMAVSEVLIISSVADHGFGMIAFWIGTGAWMGAITSMCLHKRLRDE